MSPMVIHGDKLYFVHEELDILKANKRIIGSSFFQKGEKTHSPHSDALNHTLNLFLFPVHANKTGNRKNPGSVAGLSSFDTNCS